MVKVAQGEGVGVAGGSWGQHLGFAYGFYIFAWIIHPMQILSEVSVFVRIRQIDATDARSCVFFVVFFFFKPAPIRSV